MYLYAIKEMFSWLLELLLYQTLTPDLGLIQYFSQQIG